MGSTREEIKFIIKLRKILSVPLILMMKRTLILVSNNKAYSAVPIIIEESLSDKSSDYEAFASN